MSDTDRPKDDVLEHVGSPVEASMERVESEPAGSAALPTDISLPPTSPPTADDQGILDEAEQPLDPADPELAEAPDPESESKFEPEPEADPDGATVTADESAHESAEPRVLQLLEGLSSGRISPKAITTATRRQIVEHVQSQGLSIPEIASMLQVSDRTIRRDQDAIRAANILHADPKLPNLLGGEVLSEARHSIARIRRATREKDCPHASRIEGERAIIAIYGEMVLILQRLGLLPSAASTPLAMPAELALGGDAAVLIAESRRLTVLINQGALGEQPARIQPEAAVAFPTAAPPKGQTP